MSDYGILLQLFFITPVCHFLLNNPRANQNNKQRGLIYAILFLLVAALLTAYLSTSASPPSYYQLLNVPTTASTTDIRRAYKAAAIRLHPDKNPSVSAATEFARLQAAYEILEKPDTRAVYDRWGEEAAVRSVREPSTAAFNSQRTMDTLLFYVIWLALTYILCLSRDALLGRNAAWVLLFCTGVVEYQMLYGSFNPLSALLPYTPLFDKVSFLHHLYPALMNACRLLSQFLFVDYDALERAFMRDILLSNMQILRTVQQIQLSIERGKVRPGEEQDDGTGTGALPLDEQMRVQQGRLERQQQMLAETKVKSSGGLPSWAVPIGLFILFNYFGRGSSSNAQNTS